MPDKPSQDEKRSKLDNLKPRPYLLSEPEDLVHVDCSEEWRHSRPALVGLLEHRAKDRPATVGEMNEAARAMAAEKHARQGKP